MDEIFCFEHSGIFDELFEISSWQTLQSFLTYVRENLAKENKQKKYRSDNIQKEICTYKPRDKFMQNYVTWGIFISKLCWFKFAFKHYGDYEFCQNFCDKLSINTRTPLTSTPIKAMGPTSHQDQDISTNISLENDYVDTSTLYHNVLSLLDKNNSPFSVLAKQIDASKLYIPFIRNEYRGNPFNYMQWKVIKLFEHHYAVNHEEDILDDGMSTRKQRYLEECKKFADTEELLTIVKNHTAVNMKRKNHGAQLTGPLLTLNDVQHIPFMIENDIKSLLPRKCKVTAFDCTSKCSSQICGLHLLVEIDSNEIGDKDVLSSMLTSHCKNTHCLIPHEIIYVESGTFETAISFKHEGVQRFHLKDALSKGRLGSSITFIWKKKEVEMRPTTSLDITPPCCFEHVCNNPLLLDKYDIISEWCCHVPLPIQLHLMGLFLNERAMKRTSDPENYVKSRLGRLLMHYDALLHIRNQKYNGFFQELNTDQLALLHHHLTTVFAVTSHAGVTHGKKIADHRIKELTDPDLIYYNTFVKKHPVTYPSGVGITTKYLSIRECHVILLCDQIVRLQLVNNPEPGKTKTTQLSILPMTLIGIPSDHTSAKTWHLETCDGTTCRCKADQKLTKSDFKSVFMELTKEEKKQLENVQTRATFGLSEVWKWLKENEHSYLDEILSIDSVLNTTLESLDSTFDKLDISGNENTPPPSQLMTPVCEFLKEAQAVEEESITRMSHTLKSLNFDREISILDTSDNSDPTIQCSSQKSIETVPSLDSLDGENTSTTSRYSIFRSLQFREEVPRLNIGLADGDSLSTTSKCSTASNIHYDDIEHANISSDIPDGSYNENITSSLLVLHPRPVVGKDHDVEAVSEILTGTLEKLGDNYKDKIIFPPDHKFQECYQKLYGTSKQYDRFIPECPVLHARKSKINNIIAAYKSAGIHQLLQHMCDKQDEIKDIVSPSQIEAATKVIIRLGAALHIVIMLRFMETLEIHERKILVEDLVSKNEKSIYCDWGERYNSFVNDTCSSSNNFQLHIDMMKHVDEIASLHMAERTGGKLGYSILQATMKSSLPFSFLNGASSYAGFTCQLLLSHATSGPFYQKMKEEMWSLQMSANGANFGLDAYREIEHITAAKAFRPGSTVEATAERMAAIDHLIKVDRIRKELLIKDNDSLHSTSKSKIPYMAKCFTETDMKYIMRGVKVMMRQNDMLDKGALTNIYDANKSKLSTCLLDRISYPAGEYLITRYLCTENILGLSDADIPLLNNVQCPAALKRKLKSMAATGTTLVRSKIKDIDKGLTIKQKKEKKVESSAARNTKVQKALESEFNLCQSFLDWKGRKFKSGKHAGVKKTLIDLLITDEVEDKEKECKERGLISFKLQPKKIPAEIRQKIKFITVEFAGSKFQAKCSTGLQYVEHVQRSLLQPLLILYPLCTVITICEEKYSFTPDFMKMGERENRKKKNSKVSSLHLLSADEMLNKETFHKKGITTTSLGKALISKWFAKHLDKLNIKRKITLYVDSDHILKDRNSFTSATPLCAEFTSEGLQKITKMDHIEQTKGEAEASQIDWLPDALKVLDDGDSVLCYISSGDIDAVVLHMLAVYLIKWPRNQDGKYKHQLIVALKKTGGRNDYYNITEIILQLEKTYKEDTIVIPLLLAMAGNDFFFKFKGITHHKFVNAVLTSPDWMKDLIQVIYHDELPIKAVLNETVFKALLKKLFCPKSADYDSLTYNEARQITVKYKEVEQAPWKWLPTEESATKIVKLYNCIFDYMFTIGNHSAPLPEAPMITDEDGNPFWDLGNTKFDKQSSIPAKRKRITTHTTPLKPRVKKTK